MHDFWLSHSSFFAEQDDEDTITTGKKKRKSKRKIASDDDEQEDDEQEDDEPSDDDSNPDVDMDLKEKGKQLSLSIILTWNHVWNWWHIYIRFENLCLLC